MPETMAPERSLASDWLCSNSSAKLSVIVGFQVKKTGRRSSRVANPPFGDAVLPHR
jgi:hypothetical protein